jgi:hypothetical protein
VLQRTGPALEASSAHLLNPTTHNHTQPSDFGYDEDPELAEGASPGPEGRSGEGSDAAEAASGSAATGSGLGTSAGSGSEEEMLDDAALARRLQEQEQRELYQRMMEMSGYTAIVQGALGGRRTRGQALCSAGSGARPWQWGRIHGERPARRVRLNGAMSTHSLAHCWRRTPNRAHTANTLPRALFASQARAMTWTWTRCRMR